MLCSCYYIYHIFRESEREREREREKERESRVKARTPNKISVMIISTARTNKRHTQVHVKREVKVTVESKILGNNKGYG